MFYSEVPEGSPDPIFGLSDAYNADQRSHKVNLVIGIYKNEQLESELLPSVRQAFREVAQDGSLVDYLPIDGLKGYTEAIGRLLFGDTFWGKSKEVIYAAQAVGGTGALRVGGEFCSAFIGKKFYIPNLTWANHRQIFEKVASSVETYPYFDPEKRAFSLSPMLSFLQKLAPNSIVLLQGPCHNPTGCDPTKEEWTEIAKTMKAHRLVPFFDVAYQGFGCGLEEDMEQVRLFLEEGMEFLVAYSCSKNFSLYCQRVGALFVVAKDLTAKQRISSQVKKIIRTLYSNPPAFGANVVEKILTSDLSGQWRLEVDAMRNRISKMRHELVEKLSKKCQERSFDDLLSHRGMFSFVNLKKNEVARLIDEFAIYLPDNGRINVSGLNSQNIDDVVESLAKVMG